MVQILKQQNINPVENVELEVLKIALRERDEAIVALEKQVAVFEKAHGGKMKQVEAERKERVKETTDLQKTVKELEAKLEEKDKELRVRNLEIKKLSGHVDAGTPAICNVLFLLSSSMVNYFLPFLFFAGMKSRSRQ